MWLLAGLGNPGPAYQGHRHNIGFMALDRIVQHYGLAIASWKRQFQGETREITVGTEKILALKPQTYMNDSGLAVQAAAHFYKIPPDHVAVLHDDLDLALGRVEVKRGGGHGGHNGLKSIDAHLGNDYWRIRLGIGHPGPTLPREIKQDLVLKHVLSNFSKAELAAEQPVLAVASGMSAQFIAARHRQRAGRTLQRSHPLLQHRRRGVADPGIDVAVFLKLKEVRRLLGIIKDVGSRLINRHCARSRLRIGYMPRMHHPSFKTKFARRRAIRSHRANLSRGIKPPSKKAIERNVLPIPAICTKQPLASRGGALASTGAW